MLNKNEINFIYAPQIYILACESFIRKNSNRQGDKWNTEVFLTKTNTNEANVRKIEIRFKLSYFSSSELHNQENSSSSLNSRLHTRSTHYLRRSLESKKHPKQNVCNTRTIVFPSCFILNIIWSTFMCTLDTTYVYQ